MLEIICLVYLVLVLILGSVSLIFLKNKFKKMSIWRMLLFIALQPLLILREIIKK
jgi:hypothetical protein